MRIAARRAERQGDSCPCDDRARIEQCEPELCGPAADGQRDAHTDRRQWAARVEHSRIDRHVVAELEERLQVARHVPPRIGGQEDALQRKHGQRKPEQRKSRVARADPFLERAPPCGGVAELPSGATREPSLPASAVIVLCFACFVLARACKC